jgi:hypothetical protein
MKRKKNFLNVAMVGIIAIFLYLPVTVIAGGGPNPNVPAGYKQIGPGLKGFLLGGWIEPATLGPGVGGDVELFLAVEDKLYNVVLYEDNPEGLDCTPPNTGFLCTTAVDITTFQLPQDLVDDYGMGDLTIARVLEEKDVSNFRLIENISPSFGLGTGSAVIYKHMFHCMVKITFLEPVKKQPPLP